MEESVSSFTDFVVSLRNSIENWLSKAQKKVVNGKAYGPESFLYVPDPEKPDTWKLPVFDEHHMALAAAALGKGMMGNKVEIPAEAKAAARSKLRSMYSRAGMTPPDSLKKESGLTVFKDQKGQWRWIANYSNNFRDNDHPAEIIAKESHENFVKMVDDGEAEMPELWHWHVRGSAWGKADWIAYDPENGVAMAAGIILPGHEKEAELLVDVEIPIGVSHGMPSESIVRDAQDNSIIVRHITKEISDLPLWAAANKLTSFYVFKETDEMAIPEQKKQYLKGLGVSDEMIQELEAMNSQTKQVAEALNIESKEAEPVATEDEKAKKPPVAESGCKNMDEKTGKCMDEEMPFKKETTEETVDEKREDVQFVTAVQFAEAITAITKSVNDAMVAMKESLSALQTEVKEVKEKESNDTRAIPSASLAALIAQGMSVTSDNSARVSKKEAKQLGSPEETEPDPKPKQSFGNPVVDQVIGNIIGMK